VPLYFALLREIERLRHRQGFSHAALEFRAGISEGHLSKMNSPARTNGRVASWQTLQYLVDALLPGGATVKLIPLGPKPIAAGPAIHEHQMKILRAYERQKWAQFAPIGGLVRMEKLSPEERRELGRRGMRARWRHKKRLRPRTPRETGGSNGNATRPGCAEPR